MAESGRTKIVTADMERASEEVCVLLKLLASPSRLMIVCHLLGGERSVGELVELLGTSQSTVSQNLALLRSREIVSTRREAQTIWYSISSEPVRRIVETLHQVSCPVDFGDGEGGEGSAQARSII